MIKSDADPIRHLWLATVLLTRLPVPRLPSIAFRDSPHAVWAYPLVGLLVGGIAVVVAQIALWLGLSSAIAAGIALGAMMLTTGAMHEDGLADTFDGLWGGQTRQRRLEIMRDSQIGTYGVLALVLVTGLRWTALTALAGGGAWPSILAAACLSRGVMPVLMTQLPHARDDGLSHSVGRPKAAAAWGSAGIGVLATLVLMGGAGVSASLIVGLLVFIIGTIARAKIAGQTGDILGATQQLAETVVLLVAVAALQ